MLSNIKLILGPILRGLEPFEMISNDRSKNIYIESDEFGSKVLTAVLTSPSLIALV